jgi:hypothetical protein
MNKFNIPIINPLNNNSSNVYNHIWHFDIKLVENPKNWISINGIYFDKCYSRLIKSIKNSEVNVLFGIQFDIRYHGKVNIRK